MPASPSSPLTTPVRARHAGARRAVVVPALAAALASAVAVCALLLAPAAHAAPTRDVARAVAAIKAHHDTTRAGAGLQPLVEVAGMDAVAQAWAQEMADASDRVGSAALVHSSTDTSGRYDYATHIPTGWVRAAENIGFTSSDDPDDLYAAWLASPPHRATIYTAAYGSVGYGVAFNAHGDLYSAVEFADYPTAPAGTVTSSPTSSASGAATTASSASSSASTRPVGTATPGPGPADPTGHPSATRSAAAPSPTATATGTATASRTATATASPSATAGPSASSTASPSATAGPSIIATGDRFATAVALARARAHAPTRVVIASGARPRLVDAASAAPLAASLDAPLLLTGHDALPDAAVSYLHETASITSALVVGGRSVVTDAVVAQLRGLGLAVTRVGGRDRWATSALVATQPSLAGAGEVLLVAAPRAGGGWLGDALSASGTAAALRAPVLLVPARAGALAEATRSAVHGRAVVAVGSRAVLPGAVARALGASVRLAGDDRFATSLAVARWGLAHGVSARAVVVASGAPDGLAEASTAGSLGQPVLLVHRAGWGPEVSALAAAAAVTVVGEGTPTR